MLATQNYKVFAMAYHGLVLPLSVALFLVVKNWHIACEKIRTGILFLAPLSFAVYVIHTQGVVHTFLWDAVGRLFSHASIYSLPFLCLAVSFGVYMIGVAIDFVRVTIFRYLIRKLHPAHGQHPQ